MRFVTLTRESPAANADSRVYVSQGSVMGTWNSVNVSLVAKSVTGKHLLLASNHYYGVAYETVQDWTQLAITYSDHQNLAAGPLDEWVGLTLTWSPGWRRAIVVAVLIAAAVLEVRQQMIAPLLMAPVLMAR